MTIKVNYQSVFHYILIYMLLAFQGNAYFKGNEDIYLVIGLALSVFAIVVRRKRLPQIYRLNGPYGAFTLLIVAFLLICFASTGGSLSLLSIGNVFARLLLAYATLTFDVEMFVHRYIKFVYVLSCISLVGFAIQTVAPGVLLAVLPTVSYGDLHGFLFYMYSPRYHTTRNIGMYTEPGLYAIVLCIAIFFLMFYGEKYFESERKKRVCLVVLIIALITAKSTTGYVGLIIILVCRLFDRRENFEMRRSLKWIIALIAVFVSVDLLRGSDSVIQTFFLSKLFSDQGTLDLSASSSGNARVVSALADIQVMLRYPLGAGYDIYDEIWSSYWTEYITDSSSCAGLTKSLATYGIPAVVSYFAMLLYYMRKSHRSIVAKICSVVLFVVMTMSQPTVFYPAFICMFMIGNDGLDEESEETLEIEESV